MSLLNDALRKNRTDAHRASPNDPGQLPIPKRAAKTLPGRTWMIIIGGVLLSAAIFGGYMYTAGQWENQSFQAAPVINKVDSVSDNVAPQARIVPAIAIEPPTPEVASEAAPVEPDPVPSPQPAPVATLSPAEPIQPPTAINTQTPKIAPNKSRKQLTKVSPPTIVKQPAEQKNTISIKGPPPDTDHLYTKARRYQRQGQLDQAIDMYNEILQLDALHFNARFNLISAYLQKGLPDKAYLLALDLHNQWPENPEIMLNLAAASIGIGEASKGLALLNQAQQLPNAPLFEIYLHQGIANRHLGHMETAIAYYRKAEQRRPEDPRLLFNLAVAFDLQKDYEKAVEYYLAYIKANQTGNAINQRQVERRIQQLRADISTPATGDLTPQ